MIKLGRKKSVTLIKRFNHEVIQVGKDRLNEFTDLVWNSYILFNTPKGWKATEENYAKFKKEDLDYFDRSVIFLILENNVGVACTRAIVDHEYDLPYFDSISPKDFRSKIKKLGVKPSNKICEQGRISVIGKNFDIVRLYMLDWAIYESFRVAVNTSDLMVTETDPDLFDGNLKRRKFHGSIKIGEVSWQELRTYLLFSDLRKLHKRKEIKK